MNKIWKNFIKTLIYIFTPLFVFYAICFVISTFTIDGILWYCLEIPENLLNLSTKVTNIGTIPVVSTMVLILINLGNIAFKTNTQNKKNSLNMALLEDKQNKLMNNQKVMLIALDTITQNIITMDDMEKQRVHESIVGAINKIDNSLANTIDFDNLDVDTIKKELAALKDISKGISEFIKK
jgi:hypothetical protein